MGRFTRILNDPTNDDDYYSANATLQQEPVILGIEIFTIVISVISMIFSGSVVFILAYKYEKLMVGRSLVHIVMMIAICDTIIAFSYAAGYPSGNMCKLQVYMIALTMTTL